jgi:G2/mitotic-specific cyclin-B2
VDANTHTLAKYLMELTVVEYDLAHLRPSEIAAAALCLSMKLICDNPDWVCIRMQNTDYKLALVLDIQCIIRGVMFNLSKVGKLYISLETGANCL